MNILHVISSGGMFGAESVILNLSRELNREGHVSLLGSFSNSANRNLQLHLRALNEGIESHLINCQGQMDRSVPEKIRALVTDTGADLVHAHGYKADVYSWMALRTSHTALVSTCHNWIDDGLLVRIYGNLDRRVLRQYQAVIAVSEEVKARLIASGVLAQHIHLIRNGIDLRPYDSATPSLRAAALLPGTLLVGWVGRLSHEKGADILLRAAGRIHTSFPQARFLLVGDGPDRDSLTTLIRELGLTDKANLVGLRTDMPEVYASFDLMVCSSRREGLPMAILEGMATGLPWIATAVGDVPTLVKNENTGLLVHSEDVEQLANALAVLLRDAGMRAQMGSAARRLVKENFSAKRMAAEYLTVYREALNSIGKPPNTTDPIPPGGAR